MALHLIKLCVGIDSADELRAWRATRAAQGHKSIVPTRQTPKRFAELVQGGSLYWVIKGQVLLRQTILRVDTLDHGQQPCRIELDPDLIAVAPMPRRPFQGWRYLETKDAPPDLSTAEGEQMPEALAKELRELGAW
ncbi:MAG: hypothetical protein JWP35_3931 [Caulobacter sp.]|nr:hypothetical protein [Caulobacter sp.]